MKVLSILLCFVCHVAFAKISQRIEPASIQIGSSFRIIYTIQDTQNQGMPNLTPFKTDFNIVGTERNMSYSIINGQAEAVSQWIILLIPKKVGTLTIPAIRIGQEQTTAAQIEVTEDKPQESEENAPLTDDEVHFKTAIKPEEPFVNQQVLYTIKLYNNQRLLDADYQPPQVEDALLVPLGDSHRYQDTLDGHSYMVEEQQYAIFPQKSGDLVIKPPRFKGLLYDVVPRRINIQGKKIKLHVKPKPQDFTDKTWFPAKNVTLSEQYDQTATQLKQGATLLRTITIQATGVPAQLIPNLELASNQGFNYYPGKPEQRNIAKQGEVIGTETITITYLLNKSGQINIPELRIPWFNTETGKAEVAVLPPHSLEILPKISSQPIVQSSSQNTPLPVNSLKPTGSKAPSSFLAWSVAAGLGIAWSLTLILWGWSRQQRSASKRSHRRALKSVHAACKKNDPELASQALVNFAKLHWPDVSIAYLHDLFKVVYEPLLKRQISLLIEALYGKSAIPWQGAELWRTLNLALHAKSSQKKKKDDALPPINP